MSQIVSQRPLQLIPDYAGPYVVELEPGVWIAPWMGDPGRTLALANAKRFVLRGSAKSAIRSARQFRGFEKARIVPISKYRERQP